MYANRKKPSSLNNPMSKWAVQNRSFLALVGITLKTLKILMPQTLGETRFDFDTFLAAPRKADIHALRSIEHSGLKPVIRQFRSEI
ncbi:MAG: hypothetical protein AAF968_11820 [Pseudomonadota bacterium]